jgi:hypothetical protein
MKKTQRQSHTWRPVPAAAVASAADVLERMIRDSVIIPDRSKEGPAKIIPTRAAKKRKTGPGA